MKHWALTAGPAGKWCALREAQLSRNHSLHSLFSINEGDWFFYLSHSKPSLVSCPPEVREEQLVTLPRCQLGSLVHQQCLICTRPSHADLDRAWNTPFLYSPLGEICCNFTPFPGEHICALQRLHLTLLWAEPCERQMFMELGLATPWSPLEMALSRTFSKHVCRGLHCCYSAHAEE